MLPSDHNLDTNEYIKYFVTDENTIRHFQSCLDEIEDLNSQLLGTEEEIAGLEYDLNELQESYNDLRSQYDDLMDSLVKLVDKIQD